MMKLQAWKGSLLWLLAGVGALAQEPATSAMYARSVVEPGDMARVWRVFDKAKRGEPIVVGVIGGSITQGSATSRVEYRYGNRVAGWWRRAFPGAKVEFVNAGVGATNSEYGALRVGRDLLVKKPDFVVIEFAVNDPNLPAYGESMEGLVRQILKAPEAPAVALLFAMHQDGSNAQEWHAKVGSHYKLPMISFRDALWPEIQSDRMKWEEVEADEVHPNDRGHAYCAQFIGRWLDVALAACPVEPIAPETGKLPAPLFSDLFEHTEMRNAEELIPVSNTGWRFDEKENCWRSEVPGSVVEFEITGRHVLTMHRVVRGPMGQARVRVDDRKPMELNGWFEGTWGWYRKTTKVARDLEARPHRVRLELSNSRSPESTGHEFWLYGLGAAGVR